MSRTGGDPGADPAIANTGVGFHGDPIDDITAKTPSLNVDERENVNAPRLWCDFLSLEGEVKRNYNCELRAREETGERNWRSGESFLLSVCCDCVRGSPQGIKQLDYPSHANLKGARFVSFNKAFHCYSTCNYCSMITCRYVWSLVSLLALVILVVCLA